MDLGLSLASIGTVLLAGVVSFASPCFLPVVPVFVGYLAGQPDQQRRRGTGVIQALIFMAAFSVVFMALWGLVSLLGYVVIDFRDWLRIIGGALLIVLGLNTAGLIRIGLLDRIFQVRFSPDRSQAPNWRRSLLLGLTFGAGWTPCIGPILAGVIVLATSSTTIGSGLFLMVVYCLGLGLPFVLVSGGASWLANKLKWFAAHQRGVNLVVGLFLVVIGFLMITDLFSRLSGLVVV